MANDPKVPGSFTGYNTANMVLPDPLDTVGTTGLRWVGGYIDEEYLSNLRGQRGMRYFNEMQDNCSVVGAIMFVIDSLLRQVSWRLVTPKGKEDDQEALKWRDFGDTLIKDMSHTWEDFISEVLTFMIYGYSPFEIIYKLRKGDNENPRVRSDYNDGLWGWRKLEIRSQDTVQRWEFADFDRGIAGLWQQDTYAPRKGTVFIPIEKMLLFRTKSIKNNPEGRSLLRSSARDYHFMKRAQENEAIGIGRDLGGMVVMEVPPELLVPNASPAHRQLRGQLEKMVQQAQVDERMGVVIPSETNAEGKPSGFKLRLMQGAGGQRINTNDIIKRYESRIAMGFLAEFIMIGTEKVGTQSLFQGKSNLFGIAMGTLLDRISSVLNRFAIARVMRLNNVPRELWPEFSHGDVASPDLDKLGTFLQALSTTGMLSPNDQLESRLLEMAGLPVPDETASPALDDSVITPADGEDQATGLMSDRQSEAVLNVNEKLLDGKIDYEVAVTLLENVLGVNTETAKRYVSKPKAAPEKEDDVDKDTLSQHAQLDVTGEQ